MASTSKLQMKFDTMSGTKTWNFSYADRNMEESDVQNLARVMIANGSVYANPPLRAHSATLVVTQTHDFNVENIQASQTTAVKEVARMSAVNETTSETTTAKKSYKEA